ncbi:ferritin family protein [Chloroflexota bacterium]
MKIEGSQTEKNLQKLLSGELQAHFRYSRMAQAAREAGQKQVAEIFSATAQNEMEHAINCFEFLNDMKDVQSNLRTAIQKEHDESTDIYPGTAAVAEEEGFAEIAGFLRRMGEIENSHKEHFTRILQILEAGGEIAGRTIGHSETYIVQTMQVSQTNPAGRVHGGELMKLMDSSAGVCAARHCKHPVVTARADDLRFIVPVDAGDLVIIHSRLIFTGRTSMTVRVEVEIEKLMTGQRVHALTANFFMVALDQDGIPLPVPPLIVTTEEEKALYEDARAEYEARKAKKSG